VSITVRARQDAVSVPGLLWLAQPVASEDSVVEGSAAMVVLMEAVADFMAEEVFTEAVEVAFTEVVGEVMVGDRNDQRAVG
jgi:hypothetical protein